MEWVIIVLAIVGSVVVTAWAGLVAVLMWFVVSRWYRATRRRRQLQRDGYYYPGEL